MVEDIEEIYLALIKAGFSEGELKSEINARFQEYQGFMSKQAILFLLAKENGINIQGIEDSPMSYHEVEEEIDYNEFLIPIAFIFEGMSNIVIVGRITHVSQIRTFTRKDGSSDIVGSFYMVDTSGKIKVVLWSDHAKLMEKEYFTTGEVVQIIGGYTKKGLNDDLEVHLSKKGKVVLSPKDIDIKTIPFSEKEQESEEKYSLLHIQDLYDKEDFIPSISGIVTFESLKLVKLKDGKKTLLLKFSLRDETAAIIVNIWGMKAPEFIKKVSEGDNITLSNALIKENPYSNHKELNLTRNSHIKLVK